MKKFLSLFACGALAAASIFGFAACGEKPSGGETVKLTVWGPSEQQASLKEMVELFKKANTDKQYDITVNVVSEADAKSNISNDPKSAADIFAFANDQIAEIYSYGALSPISTAALNDLKARMSEVAVNFAKLGDKYYGYPLSADNGFFMYYDSSVISAEEAKSLDSVLAACEKAGKKFVFEAANSWMALSFAYGAGARVDYTYDGAQCVGLETNLDQKPSGSDYSYGELCAQEIIDITKKTCWVNGDDTSLTNALNAGEFGAGITGTWNASKLSSALGDNYAATVLPQWKSSLDSKTYDWYSFAGGKVYGVNAYSKNASEAHKLAQFLVSDEMQEKRFDDNKFGPSSLKVAALDKVKQDIAISAISQQIANASVTQTPMPQSYWDSIGAFGTACKENDFGGKSIKDYVTEMVASMKTAAQS